MTYIGNVRFDDWTQATAQSIYGPLATYCRNLQSTNCFNPLINSADDRQTSHELRFSNDNRLLKWVAGLYFMRDNVHLKQVYEPSQTSGTQWQLNDSPGYINESKAAYGQATWHLTDKLGVVTGLRYQENEKSLPAVTTYMGPIGSIVQGQCTGCTITLVSTGHTKFNKTAWKAGINYNPAPDTFLYVSAATGYQAGGFISRAAAPFDLTYDPENLTNYDMGWKTQLFDHRAQINIDAYFMKYRDYQATSSFVQPSGTLATLTVNAGTADIKGIEFESTYLLTGFDELGVDATLLRAKFTSFYLPNGDGYGVVAGRTPTDYTGNELPYAPHATARLTYKHTFTLSAADSLIAQADSSYAAHQFLDYHDYLAASQDSYTRSGASLTWQRRNADWTFNTRLFVRNIENKAVLAGGQGDSAAPNRDFNNFAKNGYYMPPRTVGIQFTGTLN